MNVKTVLVRRGSIRFDLRVFFRWIEITAFIYLTLEQWCFFFSIHLESQGFLQEPCDPNLLGKHQETALHCNWAAGNLSMLMIF